MSVKISLRMKVDTSVPTKSVNLTVLRKNARGRKKPGRKQPRPGDVEYDYPEDSAVKKFKHDMEGEESVSGETPVDVRDVRASVESVGVTLTDESLGRINGTVDHGWLDDSVIDFVQSICVIIPGIIHVSTHIYIIHFFFFF